MTWDTAWQAAKDKDIAAVRGKLSKYIVFMAFVWGLTLGLLPFAFIVPIVFGSTSVWAELFNVVWELCWVLWFGTLIVGGLGLWWIERTRV